MSRNMCKLCHKVRNGQIYPLKVQISSIKQNLNFNFSLNFRLSKTYSFNPSLKSALGLYGFESLRQETKFNLKNLNSTLKMSLGPYLAVCHKRQSTILSDFK